jgi:hypothetical protein
MHNLTAKTTQGVRLLIEANFYFSLVIVIFGGAVSLSDNYTLFQFNADLYGEMANNLRIMMVYLAFTEALIYGYCFVTKQYHYYLLVGLFLMTMVPGLAFYGQVNDVEIDPNLDIFLLYAGMSHFLWGVMNKSFHNDQ